MQILEILKEGLEQGGSDLFLLPGSAPASRPAAIWSCCPRSALFPQTPAPF